MKLKNLFSSREYVERFKLKPKRMSALRRRRAIGIVGSDGLHVLNLRTRVKQRRAERLGK